MNIRGSTAISRSTGSPTEFTFGNYDNTFSSASSGLFTFYNQNAYAAINLAGKIGPQIIAFKSDIPNTSSFATLAGNNNWTGSNTFEADIQIKPEDGNFCNIAFDSIYWSVSNILAGFTWDSMEFHLLMNENDLIFPKKSGTLATLDDIPRGTSQDFSLIYSSSRLGVNSIDFPFNIDKNYFFTITMTYTGESKSFIYAKGINSTYTIVINSSTSFEVKLDVTGSSTRIIFTNKSNADPFVVRAEISN